MIKHLIALPLLAVNWALDEPKHDFGKIVVRILAIGLLIACLRIVYMHIINEYFFYFR